MKLTLGTTIEHFNFRIQRFANSVRVTDLNNAGKRGKTCNEYVTYDGSCTGDEVFDYFNTMANNLENCQSPNEVELVAKVFYEGTKLKYQHRELRGVDVAPNNKDFEPVKFENEEIRVSLTWDGFSFRDKKDTYNEPTIINRGSSANARRLHKIWNKNKAVFENMNFKQIHSWFTGQDYESRAFIKFHYYCAMD